MVGVLSSAVPGKMKQRSATTATQAKLRFSIVSRCWGSLSCHRGGNGGDAREGAEALAMKKPGRGTGKAGDAPRYGGKMAKLRGRFSAQKGRKEK
jgi:hypothetical protein